MITVTPIYAALLALLFLALSFRVILYRRRSRISLLDGDDAELRTRIRAQGNCAEYAPFGLVLILVLELMLAPVWALHLLGLMLLSGRAIHAFGFLTTPPVLRLRVFGMLLTTLQIGLTALAILIYAMT